MSSPIMKTKVKTKNYFIISKDNRYFKTNETWTSDLVNDNIMKFSNDSYAFDYIIVKGMNDVIILKIEGSILISAKVLFPIKNPKL